VRRVLFVLIPVVLAAAAFYGLSHRVPSGQPPLTNMDLAMLRTDFNRADDRPRLILLLSPT
jgi:hypothetical protein